MADFGLSGDVVEAPLEAVPERHYTKVKHATQVGRWNWKCLLPGCPRSKPYTLKELINKHWERDHPECRLRITAMERPGPKPASGSGRMLKKSDLIRLCKQQSGFFPKRWKDWKQQKLGEKRREVRIKIDFKVATNV
jgi:hypothetical protein